MSDLNKEYRRQALLIIFISILPVIIVGGINFVIDPLQIYRKQQFLKPRFWKNQREQNAGKINSYLSQDGYDSILVGNSVADNYRSSQIVNYLGWHKTMKLTVDGGHASEQAFMVEQALNKANIKRVLWVIRALNFSDKRNKIWHKTRKIPFYLYTNHIFDDMPYLLSIDNFRFSLAQMNMKSTVGIWEKDMEQLNYWMTKGRSIKRLLKFNSPDNLEKLDKEYNRRTCGFKSNSEKVVYNAAEYNLLRVIRMHSNVEFVIIVAPMPRLWLASQSYNLLNKYFGVQRFIVDQTAAMQNVKIYGFDNEDYIVSNLANYRDIVHYHSGVNVIFLQAIAQDRNRLTIDSIDGYTNEISNKLCEYSLKSDMLTMIPLAYPQENEELQDLKSLKTIIVKVVSLLKEKKYTDVINLTSEIIKKSYKDKNYLAEIHYIRGIAYMNLEKPDQAIVEYGKTIKLNPKHKLSYAGRGRAYLKQKNYKYAKEHFKKFIDLKPLDLRGYQLLSITFEEQGNSDEAIKVLSKAIQLFPSRKALYIGRGKVYYKKGNITLAEKDFEKALKIDPSTIIKMQ